MNDHLHPHNPPDDEDRRLAELLSDAVSEVEPSHALDSIRERTKVTPMRRSRPYLLAAGGAVLAAAAVTTAIVLVGNNLPGDSTDPDPADQSTASGPEDPDVSESASAAPVPTGAAAVPVYFVGDTPDGPRLYREFQRGEEPLFISAAASVAGTAYDPDYGSLWPPGVSVSGVDVTGQDADARIEVSVDGAPADLPTGMTDDEAALALQQVVYSVQGALQEGRVPVQFLADGAPTDQILGQPVTDPVSNAPTLETLALVSLTDPAEGQVVNGETVDVSGVANSPEANVLWELSSSDGGSGSGGYFTADGWMGNQLFPFSGSVDVSGLEPGEYTLTVSTDDPTGGAEGGGAHTDSRTIVIE